MPPSYRRAAAVAVGVLVLLAGGCNTAADQPTFDHRTQPAQPGGSAEASPPPTGPCTTAAKLATWSLERLAMQTLTVPAKETSVSSVSAHVTSGAGGVILFGSKAPASLASSVTTVIAKAPDGIAPFVEVTRARRIDVRFTKPMVYELDGGERGRAKRLKARIVPGALVVATGDPARQ